MEYFITVKAVGDWELDILAVPFGGRDSDGQWFDDRTDIAAEAFTTPLIVYQHGIKQGAMQQDAKPVIVGRAVAGTLKKELDGWHVRVILDKGIKVAKDIMDAAREYLLAIKENRKPDKQVHVSSGSISHLARLDVGGKLIQYEKNRPGRIAVWPLGEVSIWENGQGNVQPSSQVAYALPAMKAMYRDAGVPFPDVDTSGETEAEEVRNRARVIELKKQAIKLLEAFE